MNSISQIDRNMAVVSKIEDVELCFRNARSAPFHLHGLLPGEPDTPYRRMPEATASAVSYGVEFLNTHTSGGRVRFCTDSACVAIRVTMPQNGRMPNMTSIGSSGFDLYEREGDAPFRYRQSFVPPPIYVPTYESLLRFPDSRPRELMICFPLYDAVDKLEIGLLPEATLAPGGAYRDAAPLLFYGSSITQGGCASRPGNSYQAMLSRRFDADYVNLGWSGSAKGEPAMAAYIAEQKMSLFILDLDHNCGTAEELNSVHEAFFLTIREKQPELPILMASRTDPIRDPQMEANEDRRRAVVARTYENALRRGDKRVRFIDGRQVFYAMADQGLSPWDCTVDGCHPNDLGFFCMAKVFGDAIAEMLGW